MAHIEMNGKKYETKHVEMEFRLRHPEDKWSKCSHVWDVDPTDWDAPYDIIYVECTLCKVPGQLDTIHGSLYWPTT